MRGRARQTQFHCWLDSDLYAALKGLATERGTDMTALCSGFLRQGLEGVAAARVEGPALPAIRQVVREELATQANRLAGLTVKAFIEAALCRRLIWPVLLRQYNDPAKAGQYVEAARTRVLADLQKRIGSYDPGSDSELPA